MAGNLSCHTFELENVEKVEPVPGQGKFGVWECDYEGDFPRV